MVNIKHKEHNGEGKLKYHYWQESWEKVTETESEQASVFVTKTVYMYVQQTRPDGGTLGSMWAIWRSVQIGAPCLFVCLFVF
jgi:hypothetical protein